MEIVNVGQGVGILSGDFDSNGNLGTNGNFLTNERCALNELNETLVLAAAYEKRSCGRRKPVRIRNRALSPVGSVSPTTEPTSIAPKPTRSLGPVLPLEHKVRERERRAADRAAGIPKKVPIKKKVAVELGDPSHDMGEDLGGISEQPDDAADSPVSERHSAHFMAGSYFEEFRDMSGLNRQIWAPEQCSTLCATCWHHSSGRLFAVFATAATAASRCGRALWRRGRRPQNGPSQRIQRRTKVRPCLWHQPGGREAPRSLFWLPP